ncbi:MAG: nucleotidyltransferase family protein [Rhodospirillales bacterium]|nr:nucleotidyltransferase family protein [Rhodospirillales bacterium]
MSKADSRDRERRKRGLVDVTVWVPAHAVAAVRRQAARLERRRPIEKEAVIATLRANAADLARFGVVGLALYGSVAKDRATRESDIDLLVDFAPDRPTGLFEMIDLKRRLEGLLGRPVDLATPSTLKPRLKARILKEAQRVF